MRALTSLLLRTTAAIALGGLLADAASAEIVGKATAVNVQAMKGGRTLVVDAEVIRNERIQTDGAGSVQLLFIDQTTMNIGPNSDIVIDSFVFDPDSGSGTMAVSMTKGVLRFVGGQVTHTGGATLKTPGATMGIRGGTGQFVVGGGGTQATFLGSNEPGGGITIVDESCGSTSLFRPGFTNESGGGRCGSPRRIDPGELSEQNALLTSPPGADGGAGGGVSNEVSTISQTERGRVTRDRAEPPESGDDKFGSDEAETANQINQQVEAVAFALSWTELATDSLSLYSVEPMTMLLGIKPKDHAPVVLGSTISIENMISCTGPDQASFFSVVIGTLDDTGPGGPVFHGGVFESDRQGVNYTAGFGWSDFSSPDPVTVNEAGVPVAGTVDQNGYDPWTGEYEDDGSFESVEGRPDSWNGEPGGYHWPDHEDFEATVVGVTPPTGLGLSRPSVALVGYAAGLMESQEKIDGDWPETSDPYVVRSVPLGDGGPGVAMLLDSTTAQLFAFFNMESDDAPETGIDSAVYAFGSAADGDGRSAYIDYDNFGGLEMVDPVSGAPLSDVGGVVDQHAAAFVTITSDQAAAIGEATGYAGNFCDCEYTRWGAWSSTSRQYVDGEGDAPGAFYTDRVHLGWWVAGRQPEIGDVPTTGEATYNGHAIATIGNGSDQYVATGSFSNTVNFGTGTGQVSVGGLDGTNYGGTVDLDVNDRRNFGGTIAGDVGNREMNLDGSFFAGPTSPVGEMGGQLTITGDDYVGAGIFAGSQTTAPPP